MKPDNLHFTLDKVNGYNKPFNFVVSEREAGKSTAIWLQAFRAFKKGKRVLVVRRQTADITGAYIEDIENVINKFTEEEDHIHLVYGQGKVKDGITDVYVGKDIYDENKKPFFRVVALSNPISRLKSLMMPNLGFIIVDEFICDNRHGEKYLAGEAFKFKEMYNTFQRETPGLRCYFFGNPYSRYNPYWSDLGVDVSKIKSGTITAGENWVIECYKILPELKKAILEKNPLYKFDDAYKKYAFDGIAVNDATIKVSAYCPKGFYLQYVFHIHGKLIGAYHSLQVDDINQYWIGEIKGSQPNKKIIAFEFDDLIEGSAILDRYDKTVLARIKSAIGKRRVSYQNIECGYLGEELYNYL